DRSDSRALTGRRQQQRRMDCPQAWLHLLAESDLLLSTNASHAWCHAGLSATSMAWRRSSSRQGLYKKATAPAAQARARTASSAYAVTKIIGMPPCAATSCRWSSSPCMPGRRTSRIRHAVSGACCACKNASADAKPCTRNPTDWSRSSSECRSASSSSTIVISGTLGMPSLLCVRGSAGAIVSCSGIPDAATCAPTRAPVHRCWTLLYRPRESTSIILWARSLRLWGEEAELISYSDEVGEGLSVHLGHHLLAVRFHRGLARAQLTRDLLGEPPCHHPCHHVPLSRGERVKPAAQGGHLRLLRARVAVAGERLVHGVEQVLVAEGLGQKVHGPGFHRLHAHRDIAVASDENNGEGQVARRQPPLQLQPAEAWQSHIEHQAAGHLRARAALELLRRRTGGDPQPHGPQEILEERAQRHIIIDDVDDRVSYGHDSLVLSQECPRHDGALW